MDQLPNGLPRARGDGPPPRSVSIISFPSPPRTRGWTQESLQDRVERDVSPAHAGMDLIWDRVFLICRGLPRARGDGPYQHIFQADRWQSPPRTRGWTHHLTPGEQKSRVSPAHAGMDPEMAAVGDGSGCLPRARGDGPATFSLMASIVLSPPRTRGWTQYFAAFRASHKVSPAHAGMDLIVKKETDRGISLPRARGYGPRCRQFDHWPQVSPQRDP